MPHINDALILVRLKAMDAKSMNVSWERSGDAGSLDRSIVITESGKGAIGRAGDSVMSPELSTDHPNQK
jgi:hypothetical protein